MSVGTTTTKAQTLQTLMDKANPNTLADTLRAAKLGRMLTPLKVTVAGIAAAASFDLTKLKVGDGVTTVNQGPQMAVGEALPPALMVCTLRVVTGTVAGVRVVGDSGATLHAPAAANTLPGVATISDDGKTITFEDAATTGFCIEYIPRSDTDMTSAFGSEI